MPSSRQISSWSFAVSVSQSAPSIHPSAFLFASSPVSCMHTSFQSHAPKKNQFQDGSEDLIFNFGKMNSWFGLVIQNWWSHWDGYEKFYGVLSR